MNARKELGNSIKLTTQGKRKLTILNELLSD